MNLESQPLVSIVTPVYNNTEKYLAECIESVLASRAIWLSLKMLKTSVRASFNFLRMNLSAVLWANRGERLPQKSMLRSCGFSAMSSYIASCCKTVSSK